MKHFYTLLLLLAASGTLFAQKNRSLEESTSKLMTNVNCAEQNKVLAGSFNKITAGFMTTLAQNVTGQLSQGTGANLKISDDKLSAEIQSSFLLGEKLLLNAGFNGAITDNISDLYSGKGGVATDWGVKLGLSIPIKRTLFYASEGECYRFYADRSAFLLKKSEELKPYIQEYRLQFLDDKTVANIDDTIRLVNKKLLQYSKADSFNKDSVTKYSDSLKALVNTRDMLYELYDPIRGKRPRKNYIYETLKDSIVDYEVKNAKWTGYQIVLFNIGSFYNRKGFVQYNPSAVNYSDRFEDIAYDNLGGSLGLSWYRQTEKFHQNAGLDFVVKKQANFELPENKKYNTTFTSDSAISSNNPGTSIYNSSSKKAFDSTKLAFATYTFFDINFQYTVLFGKTKTFGLNATGSWSNSKYYSVPNRVDFFFGPVVSVPNQDKDGSKLNFGLMLGYRNVFDRDLEMSDKFNVRFNVSVPFKVIAL